MITLTGSGNRLSDQPGPTETACTVHPLLRSSCHMHNPKLTNKSKLKPFEPILENHQEQDAYQHAEQTDIQTGSNIKLKHQGDLSQSQQ